LLSNELKAHFNAHQIGYFYQTKETKNSGAYAAFKCFRYDHDLQGLFAALGEVAKNMPKK